MEAIKAAASSAPSIDWGSLAASVVKLISAITTGGPVIWIVAGIATLIFGGGLLALYLKFKKFYADYMFKRTQKNTEEAEKENAKKEQEANEAQQKADDKIDKVVAQNPDDQKQDRPTPAHTEEDEQ